MKTIHYVVIALLLTILLPPTLIFLFRDLLIISLRYWYIILPSIYAAAYILWRLRRKALSILLVSLATGLILSVIIVLLIIMYAIIMTEY
ncbi:hypothetical protein [Staphylothermus hellenicus]|uniref:Uncharacterized protein n=1 Tax=Staphylothermus hellenicus (strain DSM 12710 / JCM 10830 / BK20S6-10-b1 / P8) TaxID=591019 RepID=D7DBT8_STAHD|nr:hypothetical protein [Staphylothermus hellenicus]ADI31635.1 hypothetical protein Shell_0504 [Staphylothermus hellenicus DSM 12710]